MAEWICYPVSYSECTGSNTRHGVPLGRGEERCPPFVTVYLFSSRFFFSFRVAPHVLIHNVQRYLYWFTCCGYTFSFSSILSVSSYLSVLFFFSRVNIVLIHNFNSSWQPSSFFFLYGNTCWCHLLYICLFAWLLVNASLIMLLLS